MVTVVVRYSEWCEGTVMAYVRSINLLPLQTASAHRRSVRRAIRVSLGRRGRTGSRVGAEGPATVSGEGMMG